MQGNKREPLLNLLKEKECLLGKDGRPNREPS
jgi:hypothetical protein